jgi:hypothetical protein
MCCLHEQQVEKRDSQVISLSGVLQCSLALSHREDELSYIKHSAQPLRHVFLNPKTQNLNTSRCVAAVSCNLFIAGCSLRCSRVCTM